MNNQDTLIDFGNNGLAADVYRQMRAIVEVPGYPFLRYYATDMVMDGHILRERLHASSVALWVVRECGTDLAFAGVSAKDNDWLDAILFARAQEKADFFVIKRGRVEKTTCTGASDLKRLPIYTCTNKVIHSPTGEALCTMEITRETQPLNANLYASLRLTSARPNACFTLAQLVELRDVAASLAVQEFQSLFARVTSVSLNGQSLDTLIDERRNRNKLQAA